MKTVFTSIIFNVFLVNVQFAQCPQPVNHFKYLGCQISYENEEDIQQNYYICSNVENFNDIFIPTLIWKFTKIKECNVMAVPFFYMAAKFGPLEKKIEKDTSIEMKFLTRTIQ